MSKRKQEVWVKVYFLNENEPEGAPVRSTSQSVEGTNTGNLMSKIQQAVRQALVQNVTEHGLQITIVISPAEKDEFANPDR